MDIMVGFKNKYGSRGFRDYKVLQAGRDRGDIRDKYLFAEAAARGACGLGGGGAQKTSRPLFQLIFTYMYVLVGYTVEY